MAQGQVSPPVRTSALSVEQIGQWMSGLWEGADRAAA